MAHTKKPVKDRILLKVLLTIIAFICIGVWLLSLPSDTDYVTSIEIEKALRNYKSAIFIYTTNSGKWPPPVGEYLPDSPMVVSLDHYTNRSFDRIDYTHLLIQEIPAGSKRLYLGLRPGKGSALSFNEQTRRYLAERNTSFRADGLPYSSDILGSGDVFVPMNFHTSKGCL